MSEKTFEYEKLKDFQKAQEAMGKKHLGFPVDSTFSLSTTSAAANAAIGILSSLSQEKGEATYSDLTDALKIIGNMKRNERVMLASILANDKVLKLPPEYGFPKSVPLISLRHMLQLVETGEIEQRDEKHKNRNFYLALLAFGLSLIVNIVNIVALIVQ